MIFLKNINEFFHKYNFNIVTILFSALIFRLFIANFGTLQLDHGTFVAWGNLLAQNGFKTFYQSWSDYLSGYLYILWLLGKINLQVPNLQVVIFKLPAILADLATGYLIYKILISNKKTKKWAIKGSLLYLFNPAIFANSSLWGQVDSLTSLLSLFSVFIFPVSYWLSAISLAVGTLVKPQAAFVLPAVLYMFIKQKKKLSELLIYCTTGLLVFVSGFMPFNNSNNLWQFILNRLSISASQYPYGSVNAFSFWGLFGFWKSDNVIFWIGIGISIILITLITLIILKKKVLNGEYLVSAFSLLISFLFMTRMHERHLLPALVFILVSAFSNSLLLFVYFGFSLTYILNLFYAYKWITNNFLEIFNSLFIKSLIVFNLIMFGLSIISLFKKIVFKFKLKNVPTKNFFAVKDISAKMSGILLSAVLIFGFLTRIYSLGIPEDMYFDEIYHSFTAKLMLHNDPKAWEWWNPHPEGFAYEWTHPPLAKLGMVLGMRIFGENAFGWRIVQAILGTGSIYMVYLIASFVFKDRLTGIISSIVFSLDGLVLVTSRIGMNDSYLLFFSLLAVYLFIKNINFLSAVAFGLALCSKWSAVYTLPVLFVSHFVFKKKIVLGYLAFAFIPVVVYLLSYSGMFLTGHTWDQFIEVQKQMWWYHTNLIAEHPYTSPAWSWPFLLRPIYLYDGGEMVGKVARIYAFGNPLVFWFGLFSIFYSFFISAKERIKKLGFIVFSYLVFFLPWIASPRIMFLYHYLPSIPFLAIASGFILRRFQKVQIVFFVFAFLAFAYFYPHWIGLRIPAKLDESYYWFTSWR